MLAQMLILMLRFTFRLNNLLDNLNLSNSQPRRSAVPKRLEAPPRPRAPFAPASLPTWVKGHLSRLLKRPLPT